MCLPVLCIAQMFGFENACQRFSTWLIFRGSELQEYVYCQSILETGHFKSNLFIKTKNCFGMGASKVPTYQSGFYNSPIVGEPSNRAVYNSIFLSYYDYYDRNTRRFTSVGNFLEIYWNSPTSIENLYGNFISGYSQALEDSGYFGGTASSYGAAVKGIEKTNSVNSKMCIIFLFISLVIPCISIWMACRRYLYRG